jgi:hypothetical protein
MPGSQLKRAMTSIAIIRDRQDLTPELTRALEEIVDALRSIEARIAALEGKHKPATAQMDLPNRS